MHALETSLQRIGKPHQEHAVEIHRAADVEKNDQPVLSGLSSFVGQNNGFAATHDAPPDTSSKIYALRERRRLIRRKRRRESSSSKARSLHGTSEKSTFFSLCCALAPYTALPSPF